MNARSTSRARWQRQNTRMQASPGRAYRTVASYDSYQAAEKAVDYLSDNHFPVRHVVVVGRGLRSVEQVTGRVTYWTAAARSAAGGAIIGALFGWLFGLLGLINPLVGAVLLALYGALFGALLGAALGAVAHAATGGRRDFSSVTGLEADRYELDVAAEAADEAARVLSGDTTGPGRQSDQ